MLFIDCVTTLNNNILKSCVKLLYWYYFNHRLSFFKGLGRMGINSSLKG